MKKDEGSGFRKFERFLTVCDEKNLLEDFEVQAWVNDLTQENPLLGCNIKVNSFFNRLVCIIITVSIIATISIIDTVSILTVTVTIL